MNRISASFSIWSMNVEPIEISNILQAKPDRTVLKGELRTPPRPRPTAFGWHITHAKNNVLLVDEVLSELLKRVNPLLSNFEILCKEDPELKVAFHLNIAPKEALVSLFISSNSVSTISSFNGELDIDFFDL